jgi:hypothetical protein
MGADQSSEAHGFAPHAIQLQLGVVENSMSDKSSFRLVVDHRTMKPVHISFDIDERHIHPLTPEEAVRITVRGLRTAFQRIVIRTKAFQRNVAQGAEEQQYNFVKRPYDEDFRVSKGQRILRLVYVDQEIIIERLIKSITDQSFGMLSTDPVKVTNVEGVRLAVYPSWSSNDRVLVRRVTPEEIKPEKSGKPDQLKSSSLVSSSKSLATMKNIKSLVGMAGNTQSMIGTASAIGDFMTGIAASGGGGDGDDKTKMAVKLMEAMKQAPALMSMLGNLPSS